MNIQTSSTVRHLPLEQIHPPTQRHFFGTDNLESLEERMRIHGLVDPIIVKQAKSGYEIVSGMRRWLAAQRLGWRTAWIRLRPADSPLPVAPAAPDAKPGRVTGR